MADSVDEVSGPLEGSSGDESPAADSLAELGTAAANLPSDILQFLRTMPPEGAAALVQVMEIQATRGPYPPPRMLEEYERIYPGAAKQIFDMAKTQENHRIELEKTVVLGKEKRAGWGQRMAFFIVLVGLSFGLALGLNHEQAAAVAVGGIPLAAVAGVFVTGRVEERRERAQKAQLMSSGVPQPPQ